jgi:hypothetical protein
LHAEDRRREPGELRRYNICFAEMYCCLIGFFLQPKAEEDPEGDGADKDVNIIGDGMQTETEAIERHAEAKMPVTKVPVIDAADNPDEAEIPHQLEV